MCAVYTVFREYYYDFSLITKYRKQLNIGNLLFIRVFQSWHELCIIMFEDYTNAVTQGSAARLYLGLDHEKQNY